MSTWITPKEDWEAGDGIGAADLNRIESNISELDGRASRRNIRVSGRLDSQLIVDEDAELLLQRIPIQIPPWGNLNIQNVRFYFNASAARLIARAVGAPAFDTYTSTTNTLDTGWFPDFNPILTKSNATGSAIQHEFDVLIKNSDEFDPITLLRGCSWIVDLGITEGVAPP